MPIVGTPNYIPSAGFAFPRPYVEQVTFGFGVGAIIAQNVNEFFITDGTNPLVHVVCNFFDHFWATSSNRYTLDHLVVDWWLLLDPSTVPIALNFNLQYAIDPVTIKPEVFLFIAGWTTRYTYALPPPPSNYWTPT